MEVLGVVVAAIDDGAASSGGFDEFVGLGVDGVVFVTVEGRDVGAVEAWSDAARIDFIAADAGRDAGFKFYRFVSFEKVREGAVSDKEGAVRVMIEAAEVVASDAPLAPSCSLFFDDGVFAGNEFITAVRF